jgi:methionyl-tRNA formyltransferase
MAEVRTLFFGTPEIAVPALRTLAETTHVVGLVAQPDRPAGRGLAVQPVPTKRLAEELGIPVHQPTKVKTPDFAEWVRDRGADVAVVMAYGRILPPAVLAAPRLGCVNLHASLLPRHRGAAPITWAIADGDTETGVCLMQMDEGMDTGPVFSERRVAITADDTAATLADKLAALASALVREDLPKILAGTLTASPQPTEGVTHARMLQKTDGLLDFARPATELHARVRAMTPWPGAYTSIDGKTLKVREVAVAAELIEGAATADVPPGTVVVADKSGIVVACGQGALRLLVGQLEGRKALTGPELVAGRAVRPGSILGT